MKYFRFLLIILVLISCKEIKTIDKTVVVPYLKVSNIYNLDSIKTFVDLYPNDISGYAKKYYKNSLENQFKDPLKSIYYIKKSISYNPNSEESYRLLGKLLYDNNFHEELNKLYMMLLFKYENNKSIGTYFFNSLSLDFEAEIIEYYANNSDWYIINEYAYASEEINEDKNIALLKLLKVKINDVEKLHKLNFYLKDFMNNDVNLIRYNKDYYRNYLKSFKKIETSIELNLNEIAKFNYNYYNDDIFTELEYYNKYFTADTNLLKQYNVFFDYLYKIELNDKFNTLIYAIDTSKRGATLDMRHIYYRLVNYDVENLNIIDSKVIAKQIGDTIETYKIDKNIIEINTYKRNWKNSYNINDFDNELLNVNFIKKSYYKIDSLGNISVIENINFSDS
jgi:hypothetical protein